MSRKPLLILLAAVLVLAVAVPALAATSTVAPTFDRKASSKALKKAKIALAAARDAQQTAGSALGAARSAAAAAAIAKGAADEAKATANGAKATADATQAALESTKAKTARAAVTEETESESFVQLPGGPSVSVTVPDSGLIEVWAQATIEGIGGVSLYEDDQQMPGQAEELCAPGTGGVLFSNVYPFPGPLRLATPAGVGDCATEGAPGPVLFQTTPGAHTYELRYGTCGCPEPVTFSDRLLVVGPRL